VNFISCVGKGADILALRPDVCAYKLNPWVQAALQDIHAKRQSRVQIGILPFDFVTPSLAESVFVLNYSTES
jgi:hypothetical protein